MSLILDALDKADREKENRDAIPDIRTVHSRVESGSESKLPPWLLLAAGLCLLLAIAAVILVLILSKPETSAPGPVEPIQAEPIQAELTPMQGTKGLAQPKKSLEQANHSAPVAATLATPVLTETEENAIAATAEPKSEISELYAAPKVITPSSRQPSEARVREPQVQQQTVDEDLARRLWLQAQEQMPARPVRSHREAKKLEEPAIDAPIEETLGYYADTPFLHELSQKLQNSIPSIMYALHKYDDHTVVINKKTYGEDEEIAPNLTIKRILADGLLLEFNGITFKLSALSSWVNYQ